MAEETKTITDFVASAPDVDVTPLFERYWSVLAGYKERITSIMPVQPHPSSADVATWSSPDGAFEGSLNTYSGPQLDWFVHSWAGNRKASILDMNINVWLGPHIDVPHLVIVFGAVPHAYHYSDFIARRDLMTDIAYGERYYEPENEHLLAWRADDTWTWSVSHGTYMRSILSPVGYSFMAEATDENIDAMIARVDARVERWLRLVETATPVPEAERPALQARDRFLRENIYSRDPMNKLAASKMGEALTAKMVKLRYGHDQLYPKE